MDHSMTAGFKPGMGTPVWAPNLTPSSEPTYIGALLGLFILSIGFRGLVAAQGYLEAYLHLRYYHKLHHQKKSRSLGRDRCATSTSPYAVSTGVEDEQLLKQRKRQQQQEEDEEQQQHQTQDQGQNTNLTSLDSITIHGGSATPQPRSYRVQGSSSSFTNNTNNNTDNNTTTFPVVRSASITTRQPSSPPSPPAYNNNPFPQGGEKQQTSPMVSVRHHNTSHHPLPTPQPFVWQADILRALLTTSVVGTGYMLMLVVMTYNSAYFAVILAGIFVGEVYFARWGRARAVLSSSFSSSSTSSSLLNRSKEASKKTSTSPPVTACGGGDHTLDGEKENEIQASVSTRTPTFLKRPSSSSASSVTSQSSFQPNTHVGDDGAC